MTTFDIPEARPMPAGRQTALRMELENLANAPHRQPHRRWRRHRSWRLGTGLGLALVIGAGGVGVGVAAASGAFSGSAAPLFHHVDKQLSTKQTPASRLRAQKLQEAASGTLPPADLPPQTTTAIPPSTFGPQIFRVTDPGPDATTISVYSQSTGRQSGCLVAIESTAGISTSPGMPAQSHFGGCSGFHGTPGTIVVPVPPGEPDDPHGYMYGLSSGIWESQQGVMYQIMVGQLGPPTPPATRIVITFGDGNTYQATASTGFFALGVLNADFMSGGTLTNYGANGAVLSVYPVWP